MSVKMRHVNDVVKRRPKCLAGKWDWLFHYVHRRDQHTHEFRLNFLFFFLGLFGITGRCYR